MERPQATTSIQKDLQRALMLTAGTALTLAAVAFIGLEVAHGRASAGEHLQVLAEVVGLYSEAALEFDDPSAGAEALSAFEASPEIETALLLGPDGAIFATYGVNPEIMATEVAAAGVGLTFHTAHLDLRQPIVVDDRRIGSLLIRRSTWDLYRAIITEAAITAFIMLGAMTLAFVLASRLRAHIADPLAELAASAGAMAEGDLRHRVEATSSDEIGRLARAFNAMTEGLRALVLQVRQGIGDVNEVAQSLDERAKALFSGATRQATAVTEAASSVDRMGQSIRDVNGNVELLAETAEETSSSILEMDASIGQIASHMDELTGAIETTSSAVGQVAGNIQQVVGGVETLDVTTADAAERLREIALSISAIEANAAESRSLSEDSSREASEGMAAMRETIRSMSEISSSFGQLEQCVSRLAQKSQSIDEIVQVIQDVAEQTGLLSLNAAIIAAQAGEHGRAFSVVAEQVKELADRTHRSTREIADLIRAVQDDTAAAVSAVEEGSARVEGGVQRSNAAGRVLDRILEKTDATTGRVREIADATAQQSDDLNRLEGAMREVEAQVETIGQSTRDQSAATQEIACSVENIRNLGTAVKYSTEEQRRGSSLITKAASHVTQMVSQIAEATNDQARNSERIENTLRIFGDVSEETQRGAEAIKASVATLLERAERLDREARRFKTDRDDPPR